MELALGKTSDDRGPESLLILLFGASAICFAFAVRRFNSYFDDDPVFWNWIYLSLSLVVGTVGWLIWRGIKRGRK